MPLKQKQMVCHHAHVANNPFAHVDEVGPLCRCASEGQDVWAPVAGVLFFAMELDQSAAHEGRPDALPGVARRQPELPSLEQEVDGAHEG